MKELWSSHNVLDYTLNLIEKGNDEENRKGIRKKYKGRRKIVLLILSYKFIF